MLFILMLVITLVTRRHESYINQETIAVSQRSCSRQKLHWFKFYILASKQARKWVWGIHVTADTKEEKLKEEAGPDQQFNIKNV